jgi:hypothetical protein
LHPTAAGTYLAALVITQQLAGVNPHSVPARVKLHSGSEIAIPEDLAKKLRRAAEKVAQRQEFLGPF